MFKVLQQLSNNWLVLISGPRLKFYVSFSGANLICNRRSLNCKIYQIDPVSRPSAVTLVVELEILMDGQRKLEIRSLSTVINHLDGKILLRKGNVDWNSQRGSLVEV